MKTVRHVALSVKPAHTHTQNGHNVDIQLHGDTQTHKQVQKKHAQPHTH